jgi:hypothetical protein
MPVDIEKRRANQRKYFAEHPEYREKNRLYCKAYRQAHLEEERAKDKAFRDAHKAERYAAHKEWQRKLRAEVLETLGGKCVCCGESEPKFLAIDHINGDGAEHRRKIGKGIYSWLKKNGYPPGFQLLCHNCNIAKSFYGACPHRDTSTYEHESRGLPSSVPDSLFTLGGL